MKFYLIPSGILLLICNIEVLVLCDECVRPEDLKLKEDRCWTAQVDLVDRARETSRNVLNFAKKKLGLGTEDPNEPKRCEYYQCILQEMRAVNGNGYPLYEKIKEWTESHVVYNSALKLMDQLERCQEGLTNSTVLEKIFYGDLVQPSDSAEQLPPEKEQSKCEIVAEYLKCLSHQEECSIFHYP